MQCRSIQEQVLAKLQSEGTGFTVSRPFPFGKTITDAMCDPFLLFSEWGPKQVSPESAGSPNHPHRGHDALTYVKRGSSSHQDSHGVQGTIPEGGVQLVSAGRGLVLEEGKPTADGSDDIFHAFQVWINLPSTAKMGDPSYAAAAPSLVQWQQYDANPESFGARVKVLAGELDTGKAGRVASPLGQPTVPHIVLDLELAPDGEVEIPLDETFTTCLVYVYCGTGTVGADAELVGRMGCVLLSETGSLKLSSADQEVGCHCIVMAGKPLREPIFSAGGYVMNTRDEIVDAFRDHHANTFATVKAKVTAV